MATDTKEKSDIDIAHESGAGAYQRENQTASKLHQENQQSVHNRTFDELTSPEHMAKDGQRPGDSSDTSGALDSSEKTFPYSKTSTGGGPNMLRMNLGKLEGKGPLAGIGALLISGIILLVSPNIIPFSFLAGVPSNLVETNDSVTPSMRRAFGSLFQKSMTPDATELCSANQKKIKCKAGRISNKGLHRLAKNGVVAHFADGTVYDGTKRGYPNKAISHVDIDGKRVDAGELKNLLGSKGNFMLASKIVGVRGAINLKVSSWTGKHMKSKFFNPFGMLRKGGHAIGRKAKLTGSQKLGEMSTRMKASMPLAQDVSRIKARAAAKVNKNMSKYKKGGIGYLMAAGGCAALEAPKFIVAATAAVQLAILSPLVLDWLLSPKDRMMADGVDYGDGITGNDMDFIGSAFFDRHPNDDGELKSAVESKYLLAAMGIDSGTLPVSPFAPGHGVLSHGTTQALMKIGENPAVSAGCSLVLSPITMWAAAAGDAAVTLIASATIIGGILKVAAQWSISVVVSEAIQWVMSQLADDIINMFIDEDAIVNARGEKFGDAVGSSALAFFAVGGMSRLLPTLSVSQFSKWSNVMDEDLEIRRQTDIATLSPFDTSSRFTFLGSIVNHMQTVSLQQGHIGIHIPSVIASTISPARLFASAGAASSIGYNTSLCDPANNYAEEFNMDTGDPDTTPIINAVGMPCTGYIADSDMDITEAIEILEKEEWVDPEVESDRDDLTIDELMPQGTEDDYQTGIGYIKPDNPLYEFVNSCGNPASGDHIINLTGCILQDPDSIASSSTSGTSAADPNTQYCNEDNTECRTLSEFDDYNDLTDEEKLADLGIKDPRAFEAISVFATQYQLQDPDSIASSSTSGTSAADPNTQYCNEDNTECRTLSEFDDYNNLTDEEKLADLGIKDPRAFEAISVFVTQYQLQQSFNGEDDGPVTEYTGPTADLAGAPVSTGGDDGSGSGSGDSGGGGSGSGGGGSSVTGDARTLARQLLDMARDGKIVLSHPTPGQLARDTSERTTPRLQLEDIASGKAANGSRRCSHTVPALIAPDRDLLAFLVDLGDQYKYTITSLFGQCHSAGSHHYSGRAVDFGCPFNASVADNVGLRYGISRNHETCSGHAHFHYRKL